MLDFISFLDYNHLHLGCIVKTENFDQHLKRKQNILMDKIKDDEIDQLI